MKRYIIQLFLISIPLVVLSASPEQVCVENYYKELNRFANDPSDIQSKNRLKRMFEDGEGLIYNDIKERLDGDVKVQVHINNLTTYIGELWIRRNVKLQFYPSDFSVVYTKKPGYSQAKDQNTAFVSVAKKVLGTGAIDFTSFEVFQIENGKIIKIDKRDDSNKRFMSALDYYERKQYSKAYEMFTYEAENNKNDLSAYWLAIMLLKKQGCSNVDRKARDAMALFWLSKLGYKQGANRIMEILQVGKEPYTNCDRPINDGLISDINSKGKYGFINKYGRTVIDYRYDYAHAFSHGLAVVRYGYGGYGVIDTNGRKIVPFEYDKIEDMNNSGYMYAKKGKDTYKIDKNGQVTKL